MQIRLPLLLALSVFFITLGYGCSIDRIEGSQQAGQECGNDAECAQGLICSERRCRPVSYGASGTANEDVPITDDTDVGTSEPETGPIIHYDTPPPLPEPDTPPNDHDVPNQVSGPGECDLGDSRCASPTSTEHCMGFDSESAEWMERPCPNDHSCVDGECVVDCGPDEVYNPISGECVAEEQECCEGGCNDDELCHQCSCVSYDPATCQFQNQPCDVDGQFSGGYMCTSFGEFSEPRCMGLCNPPAANPDATCPDPDSICLYEDTSQPNGSCMTDCSIDDICGDEGMRCIHHGAANDDGLCMPTTGSGNVGDSCNPDDFFDCGAHAICVGGTCHQSCRPFDLDESDCPTGSSCLAFGANLGMCALDTSVGDGSCTNEFTACSEDATGCFQDFDGGGLICYEFCRLQTEGADDCPSDYTCFQHDPQNEALGMCIEQDNAP